MEKKKGKEIQKNDIKRDGIRVARTKRLTKNHKKQKDEYKIQRNERRLDNAFDRHVSRTAMGYDLDEYDF